MINIKNIIIVILFGFLFISCEEDPIFGLKRGWIWGENNDGPGEIIIIAESGNHNIKIYKGATTAGNPIVSLSLSEGDVRTIELDQGEYTIKSENCNCSKIFTLKSCKEINLWSYSIYVYSC